MSLKHTTKAMPERVGRFFASLVGLGFKVALTPQGPKPGNHKTLRITWGNVFVAIADPRMWAGRDAQLIGYRFPNGALPRTRAAAPKGFDIDLFAREHEVPIEHLKVFSDYSGTYVQVRDAGSALKLLADWVRTIDGACLAIDGDAANQLFRDLADIDSDNRLMPTERAALVAARIGQGRFRSGLELEFGDKCAATGVVVREVLRASHIVPWCKATNEQRLNPKNGLLLAANLDALFDRRLITFSQDGELIISDSVDAQDRGRLGLSERLRLQPCPERNVYMRAHYEEFRRREESRHAVARLAKKSVSDAGLDHPDADRQ